MTNPLLSKSGLKHGAIAFDKIEVAHFIPALESAIADARNSLQTLRAIKDPTFDNTIVALNQVVEPAYHVAQTYHNLRAAHGNDEMQALAKEMMPKLVDLSSDIYLDPDLFTNVQALYDDRAKQNYTEEQLTLLEKEFRAFKRNGGLLDQTQKDKLRKIDEELSTLGPQFSQNVLKDTNAFFMHVEDEAELSGLPESIREAAAQTAKEKDLTGWVFTLQMPSVLPFMKYADSRARREQIWRAFGARSFGTGHDNQKIIRQIVELRHQRANLLGYPTHAAFQTEERMAESAQNVVSFLKELQDATMPAAEEELAELKAFMKDKTGQEELQQWDYHYWSTKLKEEKYQFDAEILRPYFKLENVLDGAFTHATKLYGLEFRKTDDLPVYHSDVSVYEVTDSSSGEYMGLLYTDFFPRETKGQGAWCTRYKGQWKDADGNHRPHASIVCNFTKPTATKPSLLTFNEVTTLFHEFGHALHNLLSNVTYQSLSCTSVYRDFVELPSQIMENWLLESESLELFAKHFENNSVIPVEYIEKLKASDLFHAGLLTLRQLRFGLLDMAWHNTSPDQIGSVESFEDAATSTADLIRKMDGANTSCSFEHIFSGGYSAGYYGYKWAEVLDADAYEMFKENGIFDTETAAKFKTNVLAAGGSVHPMELYKRFRGREPDTGALLRKYGLQ